MKTLKIAAPLLLAAALAACSDRATEGTAPGDAVATADPAAPLTVPADGAVVARVDGIDIHEPWLAAIARGRQLDLADPAQRTRALDELVEYVVLVQAARKRDDLADAQARTEIELNALAARANGVLARLGAGAEPDEAALRAEYDAQRQLNGEFEYQVGHLLFADEKAAIEAAGAVVGVEDFAAATETFRDRARQAVDLGWIKLGQVPPEFAAALRELQPGQTTPVPVQTPYGWHVIHLREMRPFETPAFEQVREGIRRMLMARATREAVDALKQQAQVEIVEP